MSSPEKKTEDANFIKTTAPELFKIVPRSGGYISLDNGENLNVTTSELKSQIDERISKEFRVQTALEETPSIYSEDVTVVNPVKDAMYTFGVAVSTLIMMAASHSDIPEDYLDWTTHCLDCVRDDFGNHPPNVQGILNHIKKLKEAPPPPPPAAEDEVETEAEPAAEPAPEDEEGGDQTVRTTTTVKMGDEEEEEGA